ncbi:hypothetical protein RND81_03G005400, partial [Saponaria officinalis]
KRDIYLALIAKNKDGFIDETCKCPAKTDKNYKRWIRCDLLIMKWILNSIDKTIVDFLHYVISAKILWSEIVERYGKENVVEIYHLRKKLGVVTQENTPSIGYYSRFKPLWENIDVSDPIASCSCGVLDKCTCQILKKMLNIDSNSKLIQFLMRLNTGYEP